jgi:murein DD-endopeptidase MepM/ murein hydrolase activator NlpD
MPQIPDQFVPSATTSPLGVNPVSAGAVDPMRNAAPGQEQQAGADVQKLGEVTNDIGERIQNQLDNAMAKQAETGFLKNVMNITSGDGTAANPGYLNLRGQAAIDGYQDAATAIAKAKQDGAAGLSDAFQKSMYNRVASQHLLSFGREMADHRFQQTAQYSGEAAINRANTYATSAANSSASYGQTDADGNPTGDFQKNLQVAEQETLNGVQIMKGAPAGSDVANAALLNLHTQVGTGTLVQMMDARTPYSKVQSVYDDMKAKGFLDDRATDLLGKMVKAYSEQESTRTAVSQNLSDAVRASQGQPTTSTGTPDYQFPIKGATVTAQGYDPDAGGVTVNIPQGSSIQAPADGKVTQVGRDADDNFTMKIEHPDGSVTSFSGLSSANVKMGDQVERGESLATSGTADGKTPSVLWSLTNAAGQNVDPTKAGLGPVDLTKITDEKVLGAALDSMRKQVTDPFLQQQATTEMESIVRHNQQMATAGQTQLFKQASDAFYSGGMSWRSIPPSVFAQLPPERQQQFKDLQTEQVMKAYDQGQRFKEMGEGGIVAGFLKNPATLTTANVDAAQSQLSHSTYQSLLEKAMVLQNRPDKVRAVELDNDQLNTTLLKNKLPDLVDPKSTDTTNFQQSIELKSNIRDQIDAEQQRQGKEISREDKQKIMDQTIMNSVQVPGMIGSETEPAFQMSPADMKKAFVMVGAQKIPLASIPADQRAQIITSLRGRGMPVTEQSIANLWVKAGKIGAPKAAAPPPATPFNPAPLLNAVAE